MGDPAGIGPEICLRLLEQAARGELAEVAIPLVFGDAAVLHRCAEHCHLPVPKMIRSHDDAADWHAAREPTVVDIGHMPAENVRPGKVDAASGAASFAYLEAVIAAAMSGHVDGIATAPINKEAWHAAGIEYPGHTEVLAERTGAQRIAMMLTSRAITCSLVTTHVGYADVPRLLDANRIVEVIELSHAALHRLRGRAPRLAVCGLNPHAGEQGLFGQREEQRIIAPAVLAARRAGIDIEGPLPPDTAFTPDRRAHIDCYICMYHDQGLIPLKALAFDTAVNVTLGLPMVRTSVDHGTALDIAWQGKASATSLVEAVRLAARLAADRTQGACSQ